MMKDIRMLLYRLGIRGTYRGFGYLAFAIWLSLEDEAYLRNLTKRLYPAVAGEFSVSPAAVEHSIRTVVEVFWQRGNREYFEQMISFVPKDKPTSGEFVGTLVEYLKCMK